MGQISASMVVTRAETAGRAKKVQPGNREWATVIQGINSQGWAIPPFIVVQGRNHLSSWYENANLPPNWRISLSQNGWTTNEIGLQWIKHFDIHTKGCSVGQYRLLILDGHESHHSVEFELFCKHNNIITLCMPPHSSHMLQPLDVGCFSPLKRAYSREIDHFIRARITHISKDEFFIAFRDAFKASFTKENIQAGFQGAGLYPLDPEHIISKMDVKLKTPTPPGSSSGLPEVWTSKTPTTTLEIDSQTKLIKDRISRHQNSSPTAIHQSVDQIKKGYLQVSHRLLIIEGEITTLRKANEALSKRRRAKRKRIQEGQDLPFQEGQDLQDQRAIIDQVREERRAYSGRRRRTETQARRCGNCGGHGHNARTCDIDREISKEESSE
jgi:DDE superfamily endonuclease